MPKGGKAFISLGLPCRKSVNFFDTTAPGSGVQAIGKAPRRHLGGSRGTQKARDL